MESSLKFVFILAMITFADHACSQSISASENPLPVGSNVTLSSTSPVSAGIWLLESDMIVFISPASSIINNPWVGRADFDYNTSALTIRSLRLEDSGVYALQEAPGFRAELTLSVQVPISNVTLRAEATHLVEYNDTAVLMCSVSNGTSLSYVWLKGNSTVTAGGNVQVSDGGATLTIMNVTRHDHGPFRCNVSNGIGYEVSAHVHLNVSYGPSNVMLTIMPVVMSTYKTGSNITLSCSAESSPEATFHWMLDGRKLNQSGPHLKLENVKEGNSGRYKCVLHNSVTMRFSSASAMIWIMDPLTSVILNHSEPAILHESFTLRCEVTGTVDHIYWRKDGHHISPDNTTVFGMGNKTLTLNPVQLSDNGHYQCQAFNSVSNMTSSPYPVRVYYGPKMPMITGPRVAKTGDSVTLSCNATSHPPSQYKWYFHDLLVSNMSEYVTPPLTLNMSGKYICKAFNNITGRNNTAYTMLTVVDPIENVQVEVQMHPAMEGHAYNLTCNVSGPADHVYWTKNGVMLHEDNTTVSSMNNRTVMFKPVDRYDTGYYRCKAINAVGNMSSPPYKLLVNYGPDKPMIYGPTFAEKGRHAAFNCSAMSEPPSTYSWWHNNDSVANTSMFSIHNLTFNASGEYKCKAYNNMTGKTSKSSKMLTVIEAIESVMINKSSIPIDKENFTLMCVVVGPYDSIYWMKDNMMLNMNASANHPHMSYSIDNDTLHFTPLTQYSDGAYRCVATNRAGHHKSPKYKLLVNYGPLSVTISGPDSAKLGTSVSLNCSADSRPQSHFYWFFNNHSMPLMNGSALTFPARMENEGKYICKARNPITNITMYQSKMFAITAHATAFHLPFQYNLMLMSVFSLSATLMFN